MNGIEFATDFVEAAYLSSAQTRGIAVRADTGHGKSTAVRAYLADLGNPPILSIACRIVHSHDMASQYGTEHYKGNNKTTRETTTINSLGRYKYWSKEVGSEGIVILDELRSILPVFNGPTLSDDTCVRVLDHLMRTH